MSTTSMMSRLVNVTVVSAVVVETAVGCVEVLVLVITWVGVVVEESVAVLVCVEVAKSTIVLETVGVVT